MDINANDNWERDKIILIDKKLNEYLKPIYPELLYEAMAYSVNCGGKRLRPVIMMGICEAFGGNSEEVLPYAAALELIHTYSLIHDDLPAMDNSDLRRGIKTNHIVYGEAMAILAGDGLLNIAHEIMLNDCFNNLDKNEKIWASKVISEAAGAKGMIGGQVVDTIYENQNISLDTLTFIHKNKTGALLTAAFVVGGIIAKVEDKTIEKLYELGMKLGVLFQIKDDILDVTSTSLVLGKPVNSDEKNNKNTYVTMKGLKQAQIDHDNLKNESLELLNNLGINNFPVVDLIINKFINREK